MQLKNLIIVGARKFGREVFTWAEQAIRAGTAWHIKGFLDDQKDALNAFKCEVGIIGSVEKYPIEKEDLFLCAIGDPVPRKYYASLLEERNAQFATLVHPSAIIGRQIEIGAGTIIGPLSQLSCDIRIGKHTVFGTNSNGAHDIRIGDYCQICGSCEINGNVTIGEGVFVGSHATILPCANIGEWSIIGAGSVVLRRVRARTKVFGNPAMPIGGVDEVI